MTERAGLEVDTLTIRIPLRLQRRGGRKLIMTPEARRCQRQSRAAMRRWSRRSSAAHRWRRQIESGQARSITDLAEQAGVTDAYVCRLLPLTCLAPDLVEAILDGRQPKDIRLAEALGNGGLFAPDPRCQPVPPKAAEFLAFATSASNSVQHGPADCSRSVQLHARGRAGRASPRRGKADRAASRSARPRLTSRQIEIIETSRRRYRLRPRW
jgi:hypothetical protein